MSQVNVTAVNEIEQIEVTAQAVTAQILVTVSPEEAAKIYAIQAAASAAAALASEQAAELAETNAELAETNAETAATTATTQAGIATTQAGIATTQAGIATTQAGMASASQQSAALSAQSAYSSELAAAAQAGIATTQAGIATTQAGNALTSANNALNSANAAAASAASAAQVGTSTLLTGFATGANTTIAGTDSILGAFQKAQGQINARVSGTGVSGQVAFWSGTGTQTGDNGLTWDNVAKTIEIKDSLNTGLRISAAVLVSSTAFTEFRNIGQNRPIVFRVGGNNTFSIFTSGNSGFNTTTDAGFRLDVNGTARVQGALSVTTGGASITGLSTIQGTTASDSGQLGSELLTTGSSDASWTGTSFATGYTHVAGSVTTLTSTLAGIVNTFYQITYTVTGRTAGSFTVAFGGFTSSALTATGAVGPRATTTDTLVITPTSDFNGTIVLSIQTITTSSASVTLNNSAGAVSNQIRISSSSTNLFFGINSGFRNTTGNSNTFVGSQAGIANTTGSSNTFIGERAGVANEIGSSNSFIGRFAGFSNISGLANTFVGNASGFSNTTGADNSFFGVGSGSSNTTGVSNSFLGSGSGSSNTTGSSNSYFGVLAGFNSTTGSANVLFGFQAGRFIANGSTALTFISNSVFLGANSRANADNETNQIVIGHTAIGLGSNTTVIGNSSTTFGRWWGNLLIGTSTNQASSVLTMESTTRGFLPPRMTSAQRDAIASPATGLMVYNTTDNRPSFFNGTSWINL